MGKPRLLGLLGRRQAFPVIQSDQCWSPTPETEVHRRAALLFVVVCRRDFSAFADEIPYQKYM